MVSYSSGLDPQAARLGLTGVTMAPEVCNAGTTGASLSAGVMVFEQIWVPSKSVSLLSCWLAAAGATSSGTNVMSLYNGSGTLLDSTVDMTAAFAGSTGIIEAALSAGARFLTAGVYVLAILTHFSLTAPKVAATANVPNTVPFSGRTPGGFLTAQANPPATVNLATLSANSGGYYMGVR